MTAVTRRTAHRSETVTDAVGHILSVSRQVYPSQAIFAAEIEAHASDVSKWRTGYCVPRADNLWRMMAPLGITMVLVVPRPGARRLFAMNDLKQSMRVFRTLALEQYGSIRAFAGRTHLNPTMMGRWFNGVVVPSGSALWQMAAALGASILIAPEGYR